jgi:hypothetical protein
MADLAAARLLCSVRRFGALCAGARGRPSGRRCGLCSSSTLRALWCRGACGVLDAGRPAGASRSPPRRRQWYGRDRSRIWGPHPRRDRWVRRTLAGTRIEAGEAERGASCPGGRHVRPDIYPADGVTERWDTAGIEEPGAVSLSGSEDVRIVVELRRRSPGLTSDGNGLGVSRAVPGMREARRACLVGEFERHLHVAIASARRSASDGRREERRAATSHRRVHVCIAESRSAFERAVVKPRDRAKPRAAGAAAVQRTGVKVPLRRNLRRF